MKSKLNFFSSFLVCIAGAVFGWTLTGWLTYRQIEGPTAIRQGWKSTPADPMEETAIRSDSKFDEVKKTLSQFCGNSAIDREARISYVATLHPEQLRKLLDNWSVDTEYSARAAATLAAQLALTDMNGAVTALKKLSGFGPAILEMSFLTARRSVPDALKVLSELPGDAADGAMKHIVRRLAVEDSNKLLDAVSNGDLNKCSEAVKNTALALLCQTGTIALDDITRKIEANNGDKSEFLISLARLGGGSADFVAEKVMPMLPENKRVEFTNALTETNPQLVIDLMDTGVLPVSDGLISSLLQSEKLTPGNLSLIMKYASPDVKAENAGIVAYKLGYEKTLQEIPNIDSDGQARTRAAEGAFRRKYEVEGGLAALSQANEVTDIDAKRAALTTVLSSWSQTEPNTAANAVLENNYGALTGELLSKVLPNWIRMDPSGVAQWLDGVGASGNALDIVSLRNVVTSLPENEKAPIKSWIEFNAVNQ